MQLSILLSMLQNEYIDYKDKSSENYAGKYQFQTLHTGLYSYIIFMKLQNYRNAERIRVFQGFRIGGWE